MATLARYCPIRKQAGDDGANARERGRGAPNPAVHSHAE